MRAPPRKRQPWLQSPASWPQTPLRAADTLLAMFIVQNLQHFQTLRMTEHFEA